MKTGVCISGPAWTERKRIATPHAHSSADQVEDDRERVQAEQVDAVAADLHARDRARRSSARSRSSTQRSSAASA